ncbi:hypothetical protein [Amycolatopsis lurida]|uniref:Uncharacterized protein n=1 Tax=Amycolatopsis lurida NRRL 2430 TaxID=1460371 RepID=A0A2P2FZC7_AMYLU|nr:hypothetical protein [Amycolatopsis lurida]KFU82074.1 hypothetical protein BB31_06975 [Amycolatopsis lurida NRRL 2430]
MQIPRASTELQPVGETVTVDGAVPAGEHHDGKIARKWRKGTGHGAFDGAGVLTNFSGFRSARL